MAIFDGLRNWLLSPLMGIMESEQRQRLVTTDRARAYRTGEQSETLKYDRSKNQPNDNITLNFLGLAVDRSVSMLFGKGLDFNLNGKEDDPNALYLDAVLDANHEEILFHTLALYGAESGTYYLRIMPGGVIGHDGKEYPRLMALDPAYVEVETEPEDIEIVTRYIMRYPINGPDGKPAIRKIVVQRSENELMWESVYSLEQGEQNLITDVQTWPYDFPPILHGKNLPSTGTPYGQPDITPDVIRLQDRINFMASNISKIIRLYAHPIRIGRNISKQEVVEIGPDRMLLINGTETDVFQLEPLGDLASAQNFFMSTKQSLFDITRTVDVTSVSDKLGALTNFGLRVLYQDALQKLATKRELYGDTLCELARRLLVMHGVSAPPYVHLIWPDPLPQNEADTVAGLTFDIGAEIVSKQTVATIRGYDFEAEQARIDTEQTAAYAKTPEL